MNIDNIIIILSIQFLCGGVLLLVFSEERTDFIDHIFHPKGMTYLSFILIILFLPIIICISILIGIWYYLGICLEYMMNKLEGLLNQKILK